MPVPFVTKASDTPWSLAVLYTKSGSRWPELCAVNPQLPKHPTYGCVFPKAPGNIYLPDSWVPAAEVVQQVISSSSGIIPSWLPNLLQPSTVNISAVSTPTSTTVTSTSTPATTAPSATIAVIPPSSSLVTPAATATKVPWNPESMKLGLLIAGVLVLGGIGYFAITKGGSAQPVGTGKTAKMKSGSRTSEMRSNPKRRRGKRRMRRNGKFKTKQQVMLMFRRDVLPGLIKRYGLKDRTAIRTAYNDFTDGLFKSGEISDRTYNATNPY